MAEIRRASRLVEDGVTDASTLATQIGRYAGLYRNVALIATDTDGSEQGFTGTDHAIVNSLANIALGLTQDK